ncbi:pyridoxine/pyridoxamine 5'-phosphate oxidase [Bacillus sp. SD088]|uniref:pyridoxine/pyridoxamine 5'-phosphate oxidase n=1 Tax=Bacillus sp. SD088 TaxID=2782012 RepID=UPI001A96919E|nr:pyridoxal 5'-phosphate synthase [Bacillus sp. SD088]MBO0995973.1 pyridoxal 5'-phosphate synthase [Bacillus sp. SD088]
MDREIREQIIHCKTLLGEFPAFENKNTPYLPHELFERWFQIAIENGVQEPHAMTISTVDKDGYPDSRVLILKDLDEEGWYFASSSDSEKGKQLETNPNIALNFYWPTMGKQIRIRGKVEKMDQKSNTNDFLKRGTVARAIALLGKQSQMLHERNELEEALAEKYNELEKNPNLVPPAWTLYKVVAKDVEFWQAAQNRKHTRVKYHLHHGKWCQHLLWP